MFYCIQCGRTWKRKPKKGLCTNGCLQKLQSPKDFVDTLDYARLISHTTATGATDALFHWGGYVPTTIDVDDDMIPFLELCRKVGIRTRWCCAGHTPTGKDADTNLPYLVIDYTQPLYDFITKIHKPNKYVFVEKKLLFNNPKLNHEVIHFYANIKTAHSSYIPFWIELTKIIMDYSANGVLLGTKQQEKWSLLKLDYLTHNEDFMASIEEHATEGILGL